MTNAPLLKRMLDAGLQFTGTSQEQAERMVKEFVKAGQARRKDSEELVRLLVERGRAASEQVVATVQAELNRQMGRFASRLDHLEVRVEEIASKLGLPGRPVAKKAAPKKAAPKKAGAKKAAPKKAAAKKAAPNAAAAKKAGAKKSAPKKAAPSA